MLETVITVVINLGLTMWVYNTLNTQYKNQKELFELKIKFLEEEVEKLNGSNKKWRSSFFKIYNHFFKREGCPIKDEECPVWKDYIKDIDEEGMI